SKSAPDSYAETATWLSQLNGPITSSDFNGHCPSYLSQSYKRILLPMGYINSCFVPVIQENTGLRLGVLIINRKHGEAEFSLQERKDLQCVARIIAKGLSQPQVENTYSVDGWQQGLLIIDKSGALNYTCPMGDSLLTLASSSQFNHHTKHAIERLAILKDLQHIIENVRLQGTERLSSSDATVTMKSSWGKFVLRAFLIEDIAGGAEAKIGINIRWQEPFVLKLFQRIRDLGLTPKQEVVGLLYALGEQHKVIAQKLDLSTHTVKEHVKNLCNRLSISTREDLISRILCQ
ncbi:MAG: hypothetical protein GQ547_01500, partial [Methylophaga sp.]|nr:hypothetical protein [Methylophaga sp.]